MSSFIHITNALIYDSEERETDHIKQVILIDSQIRNHSEIVASVNSETFPILYSTTSERNDLRALLQDKFIKIERLGIFMEMESEKMFLNLEPFFAKSETCPYSKNVRFLMEIMEEFSIAHLDFIFADGMCPVVTKEWKSYFDILSKEGQIGFETMPYFVSDFPLQQCLTLQPWLSGFSLPCSMAVHGEHLYVANYGSSFVSRVTLCDGDDIGMELEWKAFEEPSGLVVHGKYLYVSNYCEENGYISKINLQTMEVHARWFEDLIGPAGITVWEDDLYICDTLDNKIVRVNIYNPHDMSQWISLESPVSAVCYAGFMYVSCMREDCIQKISLSCGPKIVDQWEIGNPVSIAISQKGLMYISCLYNACSDVGNLISVLDLVSGEFMENLDVSYNGVGCLMVHGGDLYLAEYLSFGLRKFPLPIVSEVDADAKVVSEIETWKEKEEYFREEMLVLEEQRKEQEEKHREELLALELRLSEQHRKEQEEKHREELLALEELRLKDLRLLEEEKHREELRVMEELRLKEEEKHREELRLIEELRLREKELRELHELRELRELREKEMRELREKEMEQQQHERVEQQQHQQQETWKDEIKKLIQHEFNISQTQSQTQNPEIWKDEIKKLIQNVIQSEISDMILPSLKNTKSILSVPNPEPSIESETDKETTVGVKSKFQNHFSNTAGFRYSGKPIDQKLSIFENQIQKMGMKHF